MIVDQTGRAERNLAIINSAVDFAIVATDRNGVVTDWNSGAESILGWSAEEMTGNTVERFFTPEDREAGRPQEEMRRALAEGKANDERWHLRKDGARFWASGEMMPLRGEGGLHLGYVKILRDFTNQRVDRDRQEALFRLSDQLRDKSDPSAISRVAGEIVGNVLKADLVGYGVVDPVAETITVEADWTAPGANSLVGTAKFRDYGAYIDDLKAGRTVIVNDAFTDPRTSAFADALQERSAVAFVNTPVQENGQFVALLYVSQALRRNWSGEELAFIREVAARVRVAAERARISQALHDLASSLGQQVQERTADRNRLWELSADLMLVASFEGTIQAVNPAWLRVLGWSETELVGSSLFDLIHPDDLAHTVEGAAAIGDGRSFARFENRYRHKEGTYRDIVWTTGPGDGLIIAVGRDVTEERRSERRQALLFDLLLQQRTTGDERQIMRSAAAALGSYLQVDRTGFFEMVDDDTALFVESWSSGAQPPLEGEFPVAGLGAVLARVRRGETLVAADTRTDPHMAGSVFPLIGTLSAIGVPLIREGHWSAGLYVNHGRARAWRGDEVGIAREIAELVWDAVERLRAQRSLRAAEEALRQSQKMEAVGQLTGGIAHDFNNLLAGIVGSLEILGRRVSQGRINDAERYITAAQGAASRAAALTHRLLAFSRRQTLDPKPTDIRQLVGGMEDLIRRTVGPSIRTEFRSADDLWTTRVDPPQLENALLNLCINARDAMPDGGELVVEASNKALDNRAAQAFDLPQGEYISLCVRDTGTGMPPEVIQKAFDPFFTTKPLGQGTGLGLSMVYGFARQSGGQVRVHSEVGRGTSICIYLPRLIGGASEARKAETDAKTSLQAAGETVLVVDDEQTVRMLVVEVLEELGYAAVEAGDGPSGLRILDSDIPIDLLVTDVGLPGGMNGRQLADVARTRRPRLKVLFITGYAETAAVGEGSLGPGMSVLTKPFAMDALAARIREMITASEKS